jgi:WD40 repeat protein
MTTTHVQVDSPFYVTGGTLSRDALCYVTRQADHQLYEALRGGQFSYVLTARQMGKSSLMVRTAARLRDEGAGVAVLDLTAIGMNLTAEQWYGGLLTQMAQQLGLEDELEEFWDTRAVLGPLQRWMQAVRQVVLPRYPTRVVVFIDEIDAVRSLPFSTDEFFAGIREFYNRRTEDSELERLSFCLLGVAAPSDLIRDTRMTPFNIGQRIELHDFSEAEAQVLAFGLGAGDQEGTILISRILYWTGGHPYLTQRLCQAVSEANPQSPVSDPQSVDRLCGELFFSRRAREQDDNLLFVRERMLRSEVELAGLLSLYLQVHRGKVVEDDETNPLISVLRLSGIARAEGGRLRVRNHIYDRVFDREWIAQNMPDAEVQRQQAAYRKGLLRATAVSALVLAVIGTLSFAAVRGRQQAISQQQVAEQEREKAEQQRGRAEEEARRADSNAQRLEKALGETEEQRQAAIDQQKLTETQRMLAEQQRTLAEMQRDRAEEQEEAYRRLLYSAHMSLAARDWRDSSIERMRDLLAQHTPVPGKTDLRGFEWHLLWALAHPDRQTLKFSGTFSSVVFSPDLRVFATGTETDVKLWDMVTGKLLSGLNKMEMLGVSEFSPDGRLVATDSVDNSIRLWDTAAGREVRRFDGHTKPLRALIMSPDGRMLASAGEDQTAKVWDVGTGNLLATLKGHKDTLNSVAFSPDGRKIATASDDETVKIWDLRTGQELMTLKEHPAKGLSSPPWISRAAFSPDGKRILAIGNFVKVAVWDAETGQALQALEGQRSMLTALVFSSDGKLMATGSADRTISLWDVKTWRVINTLIGHGNAIAELAFSKDSKTLASASTDKTIKLWDVAADPNPLLRMGVAFVAYSPDGRTMATAQGKEVKLWDTATWNMVGTLTGHTAEIKSLAYSADGKILASGSGDKTATLWDAATGLERFTLKGHTGKVLGVALSPDGRLLATGSEDKTVRLWDVTTGQELARLDGHEAVVHGVVFSSDGRLIASASHDTTVRIWNVAARREAYVFRGHTSEVYNVAFSPDGKLLASTSDDSTIKFWDVAGRKEVSTLKGHGGAALALAFSPDGKRLASSGDDFSVRLWDVGSGQELAALRRSPAPVWSLAFSPDGNTLVTGSGFSGLLNVWRAATEQEVRARGSR